jgi:hypothetical protein
MFGKLIIKLANWYDFYCRRNNLQDEQFFINWQDKLNEISIR